MVEHGALSSMNDAVKQSKTVCVLSVLEQRLIALYPGVQLHTVSHEEQGLEAMDLGLCAAMIMDEDVWHYVRGHHCNKVALVAAVCIHSTDI
jgi:hypothetical protein